MKIKVGSTTFRATLYDNKTVAAFKALLPLTVEMTELNANEKYVRLPSRLPTDEVSPRKIQAGDVMLYGADTLVLFYTTFDTTYLYTPIGRVDDPSSLATVLGPRSVNVTFEL